MKKADKISMIKQRLMLLLAAAFCALVSVHESQFANVNLSENTPVQQTSTAENQDSQDSEKTYFSISIDAVVPFAVQAAEQALYFIYELFVPKDIMSFESVSVKPDLAHFTKVLLRQIISPNAP